MKKKVLSIILFICLCFVNCNVSATSKDVQAKYNQSYNVDLVTKIINNNKVLLEMDDLSIELSSTDSNIKAVLIKANDDANDYANTFTTSSDNYYLVFYKDNQKLKTTNIDIQIKTADKVLNVYNNSGKLLEKTNEKITLTGNDYFIVMTDFIQIEKDNYKIIDVNEKVENLEDVEINSNTTVEVYNSKDIKIRNTEKLGTNYKVVVTNNGIKTVYTIVARGDTTGDARVSLNDVTRLYHHYKGIESMEEVYILAGDVAENDIINLRDVTKLYHFYKKIIPSL